MDTSGIVIEQAATVDEQERVARRLVGPLERQVAREWFTRGWQGAVRYFLTPTGWRAESVRAARDSVARIGAELDAARDNAAELTRVRREHQLHPYSPTCVPACRRGAWQ